MTEKLLKKKMNKLDQEELEDLVLFLNDKYRYGNELVSDETYDEYVDRLRELEPTSKVLVKIGAPVREELEKVKLPLWMGSMDKVKPDSKELDRWLKKYEGPYFCSAKLDGMSCLYGNGCLYTRGDGSVGQNISYLIPYLSLPKLKKDIFVRGELIMKKKIFEKQFSKNFPKARSVVVGAINSKKPNLEILKNIDFVTFELYNRNTKNTQSEQFDKLQNMHFSVPFHVYLPTDFDKKELTPLLHKMKEKSPYEVDGIIIADDHYHPRNISGNPKYAVAYKVNMQGIRTTIEEIIWDPSMHGFLVPTVRFKTVQIDGDNITYATAFNAKYVKDNKLGKGSQIRVVKSGDVIPYISEVISGKKADMPSSDFGSFYWSDTEVDLILKNPLQNKSVREKRFVHFFTSLKIKYINIGLVKKFISAGFTTPSDVYHASVDELMEVEGVKLKSAQKYYDSIHDIMDNPIPVETVMKSSLSFGPGFGERKLYPLISGIDFISGTKGKYKFRKPSIEEILDIEGFSYKTGNEFRDNLQHFDNFMKENKFIQLELPSKEEGIKEGKLSEFFILFTGVRDKSLAEKLSRNGAHIENSLTKKTNILVVKDATTNNNKIKTAKEKGIRIIILDEVEKELLNFKL